MSLKLVTRVSLGFYVPLDGAFANDSSLAEKLVERGT